MSRAVGPFFMEDGSSQLFHSFNRTKRSLAQNLQAPEQRTVFKRPVATWDAVMGNLRGSQRAKPGIADAALGANHV